MDNGLLDEGILDGIANALINDQGVTTEFTPADMPNLVSNLSGKGLSPVILTKEQLKENGEPDETKIEGGPKSSNIYFAPEEDKDTYIEWIWLSDKWERIGSSDVDLSDYALKSEVPIEYDGKYESVIIKGFGGEAKSHKAVSLGVDTKAYAPGAFAEGTGSTAIMSSSHAEGLYTSVSGEAGHAEGKKTTVSTYCGHAEGIQTKAVGSAAHTEGILTESNNNYQHVSGRYNSIENIGNCAVVVGNGEIEQDTETLDWVGVTPSNAYTLDWNGNGWFAGKVSIGTEPESYEENDLVSAKYVSQEIAKKSSVTVTPSLISGVEVAKISVDGNESTLYAPQGGGEGGSTVVVTPFLEEGMAVAKIDVDGVENIIYTPVIDVNKAYVDSAVQDLSQGLAGIQQAVNSKSTVTVNPITTTGTKIATITIDGEESDIYAPNSGGGEVTQGYVDTKAKAEADRARNEAYNGYTTESNVVKNVRINNLTGAEESSTTMWSSTFIEVAPNISYTFDGIAGRSTEYRYVQYDDSKAYVTGNIGSSTRASYDFTTNARTKYVRLSFKSTDLNANLHSGATRVYAVNEGSMHIGITELENNIENHEARIQALEAKISALEALINNQG